MVLLHVIAPAIPVHHAVHHAADRRGDGVDDLPALLHDVGHRDAVDVAEVARLAASGGVEGGAVEDDAPVRPTHHPGVKLPQVRVAVI